MSLEHTNWYFVVVGVDVPKCGLLSIKLPCSLTYFSGVYIAFARRIGDIFSSLLNWQFVCEQKKRTTNSKG